MCVTFYTYLKTTRNDIAFEKLFITILFQPSRVVARNLLRGSCLRNICFHISIWFPTWVLNFGLISKKQTHYLLEYGVWSGVLLEFKQSVGNALDSYSVDTEQSRRRTPGFWVTFHGNFWNLQRGSHRWNICFIFRFCWRCLIWSLNRSLTSNRPTLYLIEYGDWFGFSFEISTKYFTSSNSP